MTETPMENSISRNNDYLNEISSLKAKLENLLTQESKHSHNYYDLHTRDNFTRLDVENVDNSCQRYEEQKIKKCEILEEYYDKLEQTNFKNVESIINQMSSVTKQLEEVNSMFCQAYEDYNSDVLLSTINDLDQETQQFEKEFLENMKDLRSKHDEVEKNLMKRKSGLISSIDHAIDILFESSMKRPEIELEEIHEKIIDQGIGTLKQQLQELQ